MLNASKTSYATTYNYIQGFPIRGFILIFKKNEYFLREINKCLFHCKEEGMPLTFENDISQMAATVTLAAPYPFHEIFHICGCMSSIT